MSILAAHINFTESSKAISALTTKFGGQPVWLEKASWPVSRATGNPMRFICQLSIDKNIFPHAQGKMAYIFMTDEEEFIDGTWEPEGGENAVIIQPGINSDIQTKEIVAGPSLVSEYSVQLKTRNEITLEKLDATDIDGPDYEQLADSISGNKIGGTPFFIQGNEFPDGDDWVLLLQLDSTQVPFDINFGDDGTAYAFINAKGNKGKFLWQCY